MFIFTLSIWSLYRTKVVRNSLSVNVRSSLGPIKISSALLYGSGKERIPFEFQMAHRKYSRNRPFEGVISNLSRRYRETNSYRVRYEIEKYMSIRPCDACQGARLKPTSLAVRVGGKSIHELTTHSVEGAYDFFENLILGPREKTSATGVL